MRTLPGMQAVTSRLGARPPDGGLPLPETEGPELGSWMG